MQHRYLRNINSILIFAIAIFVILYFAEAFFVPLVFAAFLAALMTPVSNLLEKTKVGRPISSLISTLIVFVFIVGLSFLFFFQMRAFSKDLPRIEQQLKSFYDQVQTKIDDMVGITPEEQQEIIEERSDEISSVLENTATKMVGSVLGFFTTFLLTMIYLFLFLLYRNKFKDFIMAYVSADKDLQATNILQQISRVVFNYLWGRLKVMVILAVMYVVAFMLFDVPYIILLTIFGALVTFIPYIGPLISGVLPIAFLLVFGRETSEILIFASVILVIQLIESYLLEPVIIGSEVSLNPMFVIIAIIIGGMVWGIAGMILFVPLFSIIRILFENIPALQPAGSLIGTKPG